MNRRDFLKGVPAAVVIAEAGLSGRVLARQSAGAPTAGVKRFQQGVTQQVFGRNVSMEDCCRQAAEIGFKGFDFANDPSDWPILKKYGLSQTMYRFAAPRPDPPPAPGTRVPNPPGWDAIGWKEAQGGFLTEFKKQIDVAAANGFPRMLIQCGGRDDAHTYQQGADNAVEFVNQIKHQAEDKGITLCMEILNSLGLGTVKVNLFDRMSWGVEVVTRVNSPSLKILYDIYQAQLMEGNVVQTLRDNIQHIAHIHTGGVPGRHQIDETQEINYRFVALALKDLGYTGFVTHEWSPAQGSDAFATAKKAFDIMNV